jgi:integrase/recombinase XerD
MKEWRERFAQWLRLRNFSAETVLVYDLGLRQFFDYLQSQAVDAVTAITRAHLEGFRNDLYQRRHRGKPLSTATQANRLQAVKSFFKYLAQSDFILIDIAAGMEPPKVARKLPQILSEDEVLRFLELPDVSMATGVRDRAILEVLYATGLRNGELGALELDDIVWEHPALWVREGKGKKSRLVPLGAEALAWLEEYLARVRPLWLKREEERHVFLSTQGRPLNRSSVLALVVHLARKSGLKATPHTLRHSMATHMLRRGAGLRHLQAMLGHASPLTTEHYTQVELSDLHKVLRRCHPRERGWPKP